MLKEKGVDGRKPDNISSQQWRRLRRAHLELSHLSASNMQRLMRRLGADVSVTKAVASIECEDCNSLVRPESFRKAAWPKTATWNDLIHTDEMELKTLDGTPCMFHVIVCAATRYVVVTYVPGARAVLSQKEIEKCLDESWCSWAGRPRCLHTDPSRAHTSAALLQWCRRSDVLLVPSPAEAHWQRGKIERRISFFKDLMVRVIYELGIETDEDERLIWQAVTQVTQTLNTHIFESGYCPYQCVFGRMPRQVTSLISSPGVLGAHDAISNDATAANAEACRAAAL